MLLPRDWLQSFVEIRECIIFSNPIRQLRMVEMGGVEPPSGSVLWRDSPGADGYLHSLTRPQAVMLPGLVASLCMVRAKLTARTVTTKNYTQNRPVVPPAWMGSLKRLPVECYYCSLIYKDAHFKDGRRIRPLRSTLHPRRNQYIPLWDPPDLRWD